MAFQQSPDVVTREIDRSTIVPAISPTAAAFVGAFQWGPVEQITLTDSENNLVSMFYPPDADTYKSFFSAANFLSYGNNLNVVRVVGVEASNAYSATASASGAVSSSSSSSSTENSSSSSSSSTSLSSSSSSTSSPTSNSSSSSTGEDLLVKNRDHYDTISSFSYRWIAKYPGKIGNSLLVSIADSASFEGWSIENNGVTYDLASEFDSAPGTSSYASARGGSNDEMHIIVLDKDGVITGQAGTILEKWAFVSKASDAKNSDGTNNYYKEVINNSSKWLWWGQHAGSDWGVAAAGTSFSTMSSPLGWTFIKGDADNDGILDGDLMEGWDLFENSEDVQVSLMITGAATATVASYVIDLADTRQDCIAFVSPEQSDVVGVSSAAQQLANVIDFYSVQLNNVSTFAIVDTGWKYQYDKYNDVNRWLPLNPDTAGLVAYTEQVADAWFSPAGYTRGQIKNVRKLAYSPPKSHRDQLYRYGINPIVTFPGQGTVLFGDRTHTQKPSAFREIGVRRLFITLRASISEYAKYQLFEFNNVFTRSRFTSNVSAFLQTVQSRQGIQNFRVVCDETNNGSEVQARQEFRADIYILPNHSINFITLSFIAVRSNVDFTEVAG